MKIVVRRMWPWHVNAISKWDGKEVARIVILKAGNSKYPFLVADSRGNKAWVSALRFED